MTKKITIAIATCALLALAAGFHATVGAQGKTVADGVFSEAQAMRGATLYGEQCAACHGEMMEGVAGLFPELKGPAFEMNWTGKTVGDLYSKIAETMPALDPGTLKPEPVTDIVAHILKSSKYPAGSEDMPTSADPLKQIQIVAPKP